MKKLFFSIILSMFVISCSTVSDVGTSLVRTIHSYGDNIELNTTTKEIESSDYAYVVGRFNGRNEWLHISKNYNDKYENEYVVELGYGSIGRPAYTVYRIKPGKYTLVYFSVDYEKSHAEPFKKDMEVNEQIKKFDSAFASFEAFPGKITYVGDINFFPNEYFIVVNEKQEVFSFIKRTYPNLIDVETILIYKPVTEGKLVRESIVNK